MMLCNKFDYHALNVDKSSVLKEVHAKLDQPIILPCLFPLHQDVKPYQPWVMSMSALIMLLGHLLHSHPTAALSIFFQPRCMVLA